MPLPRFVFSGDDDINPPIQELDEETIFGGCLLYRHPDVDSTDTVISFHASIEKFTQVSRDSIDLSPVLIDLPLHKVTE